MMHEIWTALTTYTILENELWRLVMLFAAILIGLVAGKIGCVFLERAAVRLREQDRTFASVLLEAIAKPIILIAFIVGLRVGLSFLKLNASVAAWSSSMLEVLIVLSIGFVAYRMVDVLRLRRAVQP